MKHNSDKYNLAWYRLSECVAKGERERALGMYRLLAHSIDNTALVKQLEGDILYLFNDEAAFEKYKEAAYLYHERGMYLEALALLEQVVPTSCAEIRDRVLLVELYSKAVSEARAEQCALQLLEEMLKKSELPEGIRFLHLISECNRAILISGIIRISREDLTDMIDQVELQQSVMRSVEFILKNSDDHSIDRFVQQIKAHNIALYHIVQTHLDR